MKILTHKNDIDLSAIDSNSIKSIAIDTETMGLFPHRDRLCLVQLAFNNAQDDVHLVQLENFENSNNLKDLLSNKDILKIFHYARFDIMMLYKNLNVMTQNVYCTKIASKLVRTYTNRHSLANLCESLLGVQISKEQTCTDWGAKNITQQQKEYAATDVFYLHKLKECLDVMLNREGRENLARKCFNFLESRVMFDIMCGETYDIFSHSS